MNQKQYNTARRAYNNARDRFEAARETFAIESAMFDAECIQYTNALDDYKALEEQTQAAGYSILENAPVGFASNYNLRNVVEILLRLRNTLDLDHQMVDINEALAMLTYITRTSSLEHLY